MLSHRTAAIALLSSGALLLAGCSDSNAPAEIITTYTMIFEDDYLNLDDGSITPCGVPDQTCPEGVDFTIAFNSLTPIHGVVFQVPGVQIAHLEGASFGAVHAADTAGAAFTSASIGEIFDATRVILIRTDEDRIFKLANPVETATTVTFDAAPLN